ncbi:GGDEF domain-containing protein [Paraglaciecola chathamensis]|uniref:diguanylate cyclase n=1 Tax=Paraglaciecola chathamensis TaxID=368405 RepID=A0A8H9M0X6_9ALTE|nr:GGDEF domain-containing protein [Paraglaciecola oceanifecundans]GGZ63020.1 sensor histidine kinase [Paraglaciecola oceanifecundans]
MVPQNRKSDNALLSAFSTRSGLSTRSGAFTRSGLSTQRLEQLIAKTHYQPETLATFKAPLLNNINGIIDELYREHPQMASVKLHTDEYNLSTDLRDVLKQYIEGLFVTARYDQVYITERIELIVQYKNIGVPALDFIQFINTLSELLCRFAQQACDLGSAQGSFCHFIRQLLQFDIELCADTNLTHLYAELDVLRQQNESLSRDIEARIAKRTKDLMDQVRLDPLTKIYNISAMQEMLDKELALAKRRQTKVSLVYFDVDHFKKINDTEGHIKGDEVLKEIGQTLRQCVRQTDIACRYGGDEFCLVLLECNAQEAQGVCEKLIATFRARYPTYSFSMGIAETGASEFVSVKQLIHLADQKMYLAKKEAGFTIVL